jgi:hypothetical protein
MKKKELQEIAQAAAKNIKTVEDLNEFRQMLTKITVEAALNAKGIPSPAAKWKLSYSTHSLQIVPG